jgi:hypothetical protein
MSVNSKLLSSKKQTSAATSFGQSGKTEACCDARARASAGSVAGLDRIVEFWCRGAPSTRVIA